MDLLSIGLLIFCTASSSLWVGHAQSTFNLLNFGAKGDGLTDDSAAFLKAWNAACRASTSPTIIVPSMRSFKIQPTCFSGPCSSHKINIQVLGTIRAPQKAEVKNFYKQSWITFANVNGLNIDGTGVFDGQGSQWWAQNSSTTKGYGELYKPGPTALRFETCNGLQLSGIKNINSPGRHIDLYGINGATLSNLHIMSPENSPNTDGIDISHSSQVSISNSFIGVGDDCIAIKGASSYLNISHVACGPGHGISIGSLEGSDTVEEVHVWNCSINEALYGARIKTYPEGDGYARKISFQHMTFKNTRYPIIIDQQYDDDQAQNGGGIKVSDVSYYDFQGTCYKDMAIALNCGSIGCSNITMNKIHINSADSSTKAAAVCKNAKGTYVDTTPSVPCLTKRD